MSLLDPIASNASVGENFTDDDKYLELEVEIEQSFNDVSQVEVNWNFVIKRSEEIITEYSKDMKVLSYWLYAQWKFHGWSAFLESFKVFGSLLVKYNKELYPSKEKRKVKILEWLDKVFEKPLNDNIKQFSKEQLSSLIEALNTIKDGIDDAIEEKIIFLKQVHIESKRLLDEINRKEELQAKESEAFKEEQEKRYLEDKKLQGIRAEQQDKDKEVISQFKSKTNVIDVTKSDIDEKILEYEDILEHVESLLETSKNLFEKSPREYLPFNILFSYASIILDEVLNNKEIKTDTLLPSQEIIDAVRASLDETISLNQLMTLEEQLLQYPAWLEGYYIAARMLHRLEKAEVSEKIEETLYRYLDKEEQSMIFSTSSGIKLVPIQLETWAKQKILALSGEGDNEVEYKKAYQEALALKAKENSQNALDFLEKHYRDTSSAEAKYKWRSVLIELLLEMGDKRLASALLLELETQIEKYQLDIWQPKLAIQTYETILKPMLTQELGKEVQERIYKKLSILDLQKVLKT